MSSLALSPQRHPWKALSCSFLTDCAVLPGLESAAGGRSGAITIPEWGFNTRTQWRTGQEDGASTGLGGKCSSWEVFSAILGQRPWILTAGISQCLSPLTPVCPSSECDWWGEAALLLLGLSSMGSLLALLVAAGLHRHCMEGIWGWELTVVHYSVVSCC